MGIKDWFKAKPESQAKTFFKTKQNFWQKMGVVSTDLNVNLDQLKIALMSIDVGVDFTNEIIANLKKQCKNSDSFDLVLDKLKILLKQTLTIDDKPKTTRELTSILVVGINGAGKTTTIAKLGNYYKQQNKTVILAAGDTFRAAAIEQLKVWGERQNNLVIAQSPGADSASVIFDALVAAKSRKADVLIADTAGRLHTQQNLMDELSKIKRVMGKAYSGAPDEVWLVLDATVGQNSLNQALEFNNLLGVSGIILTKLDGSAKGGVIFSIVNQLKIPVKFIGVGEAMTDLQVFDADSFVEACFSK